MLIIDLIKIILNREKIIQKIENKYNEKYFIPIINNTSLLIDMNDKDIIHNHHKLWQWIALETLKKKEKIIKKEYITKYMMNDYILWFYHDCWLCVYASKKREKGNNRNTYLCNLCPKCKTKKGLKTICETFYLKWVHSNTWITAYYYADKIANTFIEREGLY